MNGTFRSLKEPAMRGRVVAILLAIALGGTPIGLLLSAGLRIRGDHGGHWISALLRVLALRWWMWVT
ncbi:MAG: hypothetical protein WCD57_15060 [Acidobacteriaceae bacterium]